MRNADGVPIADLRRRLRELNDLAADMLRLRKGYFDPLIFMSVRGGGTLE